MGFARLNAYQCKVHARLRVQRAPGVPHALFRAEDSATPRAPGVARARLVGFAVCRHCERSEAIHLSFCGGHGLLRFARNDGLKARCLKIDTSEEASGVIWNAASAPGRAPNRLFIWPLLFAAAIRDPRADEGRFGRGVHDTNAPRRR